MIPSSSDPPARLSVWDMEAEHRYWTDVAQQSGCPPQQFAFRWTLMVQVYAAAAADPQLSMEPAFARFEQQAQAVGMDEATARLVFSRTWARILSRTGRREH